MNHSLKNAPLKATDTYNVLTLPSNMTLTQSYEPKRDLLTGMLYKRGATTVAQRTYTYDTLGRPLTRSHHPALWFITWDPTQPVATRPLTIQKDGSWFSAPARLAKQGFRSQVCSRLGGWLLKPHPAYGWDLTKNICELYGPSGYIRTAYTYSPYGEVTANGDVTQPIQWSSEFNDTELGMVYYNYRHYNPVDGRWMGRDPISYFSDRNLYTKDFQEDVFYTTLKELMNQ